MEKFDVIIVGAGLAGLAAAYTLAGEGLEVLVLERGDYPGAKNVTGGRLYLNPVREFFPELWKKAPLERFISHEGVTIMSRERSLTINYEGDELRQEPYQSYSILRAKFDRWLAKQAERKGAMLVDKTRVDDLIKEDGRVSGVVAGGDELYADVVIACDGVLSLVAEKAGLRQPGKPEDFAVGFKEVIELDKTVINERFGLEGDEGLARMFMGEVTRGKFGGGFLYTNKDSISLGLVVGIKDLMQGQPAVQAPLLLDEFKQRPEIAVLIKGGETVEYSAHAIPEGGYKALSKLFGDGILVAGDAAGFSMNIGVTVRGMEYALASGYYAAQAVIAAKKAEDFSVRGLAVYQELLNQSFVMEDFKNFQEAPYALDNPRIFQHYPEMLGNMMRDIYAVPAGPKNRLYPTIKQYLGLGELWSMLGDVRKVMKI
ncbi:MAG: FAD-dependent oxidoreductase [Syntrophomonas sp.]|uniref:FAD-dependent oxidoreductase n=1 Tax=Syntrophomonas sp. TaxID=2053627 RepID=UPI002604E827|nr:FAD-dependent oxidoreductase [Syntrophomonas sp.]MDD2510063.1 FAD-dependent oxidoreductase [Syntrophomonas sp.]MDD3879015.1 FAD-dependent oxidoreductase [Syntrophomonas sp.]MDD4626759.1 FAD-dependent oxidoreductase [Syntrophomonas sp.]